MSRTGEAGLLRPVALGRSLVNLVRSSRPASEPPFLIRLWQRLQEDGPVVSFNKLLEYARSQVDRYGAQWLLSRAVMVGAPLAVLLLIYAHVRALAKAHAALQAQVEETARTRAEMEAARSDNAVLIHERTALGVCRERYQRITELLTYRLDALDDNLGDETQATRDRLLMQIHAARVERDAGRSLFTAEESTILILFDELEILARENAHLMRRLHNESGVENTVQTSTNISAGTLMLDESQLRMKLATERISQDALKESISRNARLIDARLELLSRGNVQLSAQHVKLLQALSETAHVSDTHMVPLSLGETKGDADDTQRWYASRSFVDPAAGVGSAVPVR